MGTTEVDYRSAFEAAFTAQLLLNDAAEVMAASDGYLRAVGRARDEVVGRAVFDLPPYAGAEHATRALRAAIETVRPAAMPMCPVSLNESALGTLAQAPALWERATLCAIHNTTGSIDYMLHVLEATTLHGERAESDSERRLRKLIEQTYDAIALFNSFGRPVYVSPTIQRVLGYTPAAYCELNPLETIHLEDRPRLGEEIRQLFATPSGQLLTHFRAQHNEGHWCMLECAAVNRLDDPDIAAIVATFRDVTQQVELQTERQRLSEARQLLELRAQESQKLESLGVLAGGIAHDFNNLLMVMLGGVSLVRSALDTGHTHNALEHIEPIEQAARRATDLCRQLLAYAGKGRFVLERTNLNRLIEETQHLLQLSVSKKAVLRFHLTPDLLPIIADATQMRQVLMNLIINASDAIGDRSGTISIITGTVNADRAYLDTTFLAPEIPAGHYVYLEVSDTGCGMSTETQARIFEPFYTTKFTGRGLGLAAVLGIVRGHKGALKVYSELDKGSSFKFLLPAANDAPAPTKSLRPGPAAFTQHGLVLVVDDEAAVRSITQRLIETLGFTTLAAGDGAEAIRVFREHRSQIVCVLMDLTMPSLDGEEALKELRRIDPHVRVLLMSGYNAQDAVARFTGKSSAGFIQKPFTLRELEDRLHALLR